MNKLHRKPSIHITQANLIKLLNEAFFDEWKIPGKDAESVSNIILMKARKYQLSNRKLLNKDEKTTQKTSSINRSSIENAMLMAKVIYYNRKKLKHRGIEIITPGHKDFSMVKTITKNAMEYHEAYWEGTGGSLENSFDFYISLALKGMQKFSLPKLQYSHVATMEYMEAAELVSNNKNLAISESAYKCYTQFVIKSVGSLLMDYRHDPTKFKYFVLVAIECKKLGVKAEDYITAQFEGLAWTNGIPEPHQLIGDKAQERLQKYLYQNSIQLNSGQKNEEIVNKFMALKKLK